MVMNTQFGAAKFSATMAAPVGRRAYALIGTRFVALIFLIPLAFTTIALAQGESCPYRKPEVPFRFNGGICSSGNYQIYFKGNLVASGTGQCDGASYHPIGDILAQLRLNETADLQVVGVCSTHINFFSVPDQYKLEIDGKESTTIDKSGNTSGDGDGIWKVTLRKKCPCGKGDGGGASPPGVGSVMWEVGLGNLGDGRSAESISLRAESIDATLYTPASLIYSPPGFSGEVDVVRVGGVLRQVNAPQTLADIVVTSATQYEIGFYKKADVGPKQGGLWTVSGQPFITWRIRNPHVGFTDQLEISKIQGAITDTSLYIYGNNSWTLTTGNGARTEIKTQTLDVSTGDLTDIFTVTNSLGQTISKIARTYHVFPWGEELIKLVVDPDGAALTTVYSFYENSSEVGRFRRLKSVLNPDGSWEKYDYDTYGNQVLVLRPWKDQSLESASEATSVAVRRTYSNYDGIIVSLHPRLVSSVIEKIAGVIVRKTTYSRAGTTVNGQPAVIETQTGYVSAAVTLVTVTTRYHSTASDFLTNRVASIQYPDGRKDTHTYEKGVYTTNADPSSNQFTPNANGMAQRETIVHGTTTTPDGVAFKSTKNVTVLDQFGHSVLQELYVYTGSGDARFSWTVMDYDDQGNLTQTRSNNGTVITATWDGDLKTAEIDESGIETDFTYDSFNRIATRTKKGAPAVSGFSAQPDIVSTYTYDTEGRITSETTSASGLTLTKSTTYDVAGRVRTETDAAGLVTTHTYTNGGRTETITLPGGVTRVSDNYLDGQTKSVLGSATVRQFFDYGVNPDSTPYVQEFTGSAGAGSPRWTKTTRDWLGTTIKVEKPSFTAGTNVFRISSYNSVGQLQAESVMNGAVKLQADMIYEYDALGNRIRSGWDIDASGTLTLASTDRITETEQVFQQNGSDWFRVTTTKTYLVNGNSTPTTTSTQSERLTNFAVNGAEKTISDITTTDVANNQTRNTMVVDRSAKKMIARGDVPTSSTDAVSITYNGLLQTSTPAAPVSATVYTYDALGRIVTTTDPAGGSITRTRTYNSTTGQVTSDTHGSQTTSYEYYGTFDPSAGKLKSKTDPAGKKVYFNYNNRGQMVQTWGDTVYPTEFVFDAFGKQTEMHTFRGGSGWQGTSWPTATASTMDVTRWTYHDATGLLTFKQDAVNKQVTFTYDPLDRMATRTWARLSGGNPLVTTYSYDPVSGDLTGISYSDSTQPVTFTYDRGGRQETIIDAAGTHTQTHNAAGQLLSDQTSGGLLDQVTVTVGYDSLLRRSTLQSTRNAVTLSSQSYGYDSSSRMETVTSGSQTVTYAYYPNTGQLNTTTLTGGAQTTRTYDSLGRLETIATSTPGSGTIASYTYAYNNLNQRTRVNREDNSYWSYGYNDRGDLTSGKRYWSDNTPMAGQQMEYVFDTVGNRTSTKAGGDAQGLNLRQSTYAANSLNQYEQRSVPGAIDVFGTANAAATTTVNDQATYRRGEYFYKELTVDNALAPAFPEVKAVGVRSGVGGAGEDAVTQIDGHIYVPKNMAVYTYDDDGNLTSDGRWTYTWDAESRLTNMEAIAAAPVAAKLRLEFAYDSIGRRIQKKVYGWNVPTSSYQLQSTTKFVYDDWNLVAELDGSGNLLRNYVWSSEVLLIGAGGNVYQTSYDGNQNLTNLVQAATGVVAASYDYNPFGQLLKATGVYAKQNPLRFNGKYTDTETGLLYYGYRYYNPDTGRWISRDPIGETGGNHLYRFINNDGVNGKDYLGLIELEQVADLMHRHSFLNGEVLIRKWMAAPANSNSANGVPDTTTIRMDSWVLTFARAKDVYARLYFEKQFLNDPAKRELVKVLKRTGKMEKGVNDYMLYDFVSRAPIDVDKEKSYIQERAVGDPLWDPVDDMLAAIGRFTLRVVTKGMVCQQDLIYVEEIGIYAKDDYNFNDDPNSIIESWFSQPLGFWNWETGEVSRNPAKGDLVNNETFQQWRRKNKRGGDQLVFSDMKVTKLPRLQLFRATQ
jgi:RHS repeat-associated protein